MSQSPSPPPGWAPLTRAVGLPAAALAPLLAQLTTLYGEPHRRYHGSAHLDALARTYAEVAAGPGWGNPAEVAWAMLFHDAIYQPGRSDNEARSAALAGQRLADLPIDLPWVETAILATATHGTSAEAASDPDLRHFLDADMAILGADPPAFAAYEAAIREEYLSVVPAPLFDQGRAAFLRGLLGRPIFHTPWFSQRLEDQAQANLRAALDPVNTQGG